MSKDSKVQVALDEKALRVELGAVETAWAAMKGLDVDARHRVVRWLESWVRAETPHCRDDDF